MRYRRLGSSGVLVSEVVLGTATFGELTTPNDVDALVDAAVEAGINAIDTGDIYAGGRSEEAVGRALARHRSRMLVCTKVGFGVGDSTEALTAASRGADDPARSRQDGPTNSAGLSRKHILAAVDASLRRLEVEYIDLYQIHRWDPATPLEETLGALDDLVRAGKVRYLGCSDLGGWQLVKALWTSDRLGLERFVSMQIPYNLLTRERAETDQLPASAAMGVGPLVYQPLAGGMLTGRYDHRSGPEEGSRFAARPLYRAQYWNDDSFALVERLRVAGAQFGRPVSALALGWLLAKPAVNAVLIGAERPAELRENLSVVEAPLSADELAAVEQAMVAPPEGGGGDKRG